MNAIGKLGGDVWKNLENPVGKLENPVGKNVAEEIPVYGQELWNIFDTPKDVWGKVAEKPIPQPLTGKTQGEIWAGA